MRTCDVTTKTHKITACYELEGLLQPQEVDIISENLKDATDEMLEFFNGSEETASEFDVYSVSENDDYWIVKLTGEFYVTDEDGVLNEDGEDRDKVEVLIFAQ